MPSVYANGGWGLPCTPGTDRFSFITTATRVVVAPVGTPVAAATTGAAPVIGEIMRNPGAVDDSTAIGSSSQSGKAHHRVPWFPELLR